MLCVRCFYPRIHTHSNFWVLRGFGGFLFFYILICSKTFILLFVLICRLLRNSFAVWNTRLQRVLLKGGSNETKNCNPAYLSLTLIFRHKGEDKFRSSEKIVDRTEFSLLFKDHVCILDLLEGADALFANIIESYYASQVAKLSDRVHYNKMNLTTIYRQICSIIFEVYYFYRSQGSEEFQGARRLDGLIITLYLIHSLAILVVVSLAAAEVGEVAMDGLAVLRQRGMMGSMSDDELYFIMSMYTSYTGHFETALSGGGMKLKQIFCHLCTLQIILSF
ncbi:uncharacterized protein LOC118434915 isoform X1 [Folsomia candida]|uniref:uncharacterized protein LOC118434915 isoform X1 n=1 Tax=Folsomia candida TaxID=158441 RepID=UPI001604DF04|nr:uncharacterized protein LOC118434915 isoform X1 [Folsomia candida]